MAYLPPSLATADLRLARIQHFAFVDPNLDADTAIGRMCFCKTIVDIRAQGLQRDAAFMIALAAGDLRAAQTAAAQ